MAEAAETAPKQCAWCGGPSTFKFCTTTCEGRSKSKHVGIYCGWCGILFPSRRDKVQDFCGKECMGKSYERWELRECRGKAPDCEVYFLVKPSSNYWNCSKKCAGAMRKRAKAEERLRNPPPPKPTQPCEGGCGKRVGMHNKHGKCKSCERVSFWEKKRGGPLPILECENEFCPRKYFKMRDMSSSEARKYCTQSCVKPLQRACTIRCADGCMVRSQSERREYLIDDNCFNAEYMVAVPLAPQTTISATPPHEAVADSPPAPSPPTDTSPTLSPIPAPLESAPAAPAASPPANPDPAPCAPRIGA